MNKKLYVISLGCDKNRVDSEEMLYNLSGLDFSITQNPEDAHIIIINTCAFIETARKEAIDTILSAAEYKKAGLEKLIVTGCLPQKYLQQLKDELPEVDCFLGTNEYSQIADKISRLYGNEALQISRKNSDFRRILTTPELYAYLKIADGCNNHCTFCTIPSIRGAYKSKSIEALTAEARVLCDYHETKEIILVAQDVTAYGKDLYGEHRLLGLIDSLSSLNIDRLRLMYCYPELITKELINQISQNPKVARYIDIPFQHVDTDILKLMNRRSDYDSVCRLIASIRETDPSIAIRTTFMVGFPSETDRQFDTLYRFLESNPLEHVGIFAYSLEEDTPSAKIKGQVPDDVKLSRVDALGELFKKQVTKRNKSLIGTKRKAVYFDIDYDRNLFVARSEFDAPEIDSLVYFSSKKPVEFGKEYEITITKVDGYDLIGELKTYAK